MSPDEGKPLRADAVRNRARLLETATSLFAERGVEASLDDIAKAAGVGIGTLYRHFPTREDLVLAVYGAQIEALDQRSRELATSDDPGEALREWMRGFVDFYAVKQGMVTLLRTMSDSRSEHFQHTRDTLRVAAERMLAPAIEAGVIRQDVAAPELIRALGGICLTSDPKATPTASTLALVDLVYDGLRYGAPVTATRG
ncbi:TetR/AcrR family transcriptional regulator [Oryzihumus leptocrescens]|uniref:TetR family transcriptional regulator n=1 Tax=Oryzihumus leptocrescens TaxID=297536 RepID=A0A542ZNG5_9MICO|nr:TetR family transcriptional regulator [Oryzihumus leptocrescens]TQL61885.1 TetR family transcriptional regulator [Oryzihumus leptocrescens]